MADIINLLPDSIANQIAAGEVVQRPASVVKELLENSIDAGSTQVKLLVYEGGKNGIQVIDNGCGMSPTDARLCFERHATSKIHQAIDLESITTLGFRGEALASIAAISEITLVTRKKENEVGIKLVLSGSRIQENAPIACLQGASFLVRNLFFNVPARRRFLKSTAVELKHVTNEFLRVALAHPEIAFQLYHQQTTIYNLQIADLKSRILQIFGKDLDKALIPIELDAPCVTITGFVVDPINATKRYNEQYMFVNNRYMRNFYFHKAILNAYERLLPPEVAPSYFLFFEVDPSTIDVNIHPTKTEIKFQDEHLIWELLYTATRQTLGRNITSVNNNLQISPSSSFTSNPTLANFLNTPTPPKETSSWKPMHIESKEQPPHTTSVFLNTKETLPSYTTLHYDDSYLVVIVDGVLRIIDQHRAHARVLYEQFTRTSHFAIQPLLYPLKMELIPSQKVGIDAFVEKVRSFGLDISLDAQRNLELRSIFQLGDNKLDPEYFLSTLYEEFTATDTLSFELQRSRIHVAFSFALAYRYGFRLSDELRIDLVNQLFACNEPMLDPHRRPTMFSIDKTLIQRMLRAKS